MVAARIKRLVIVIFADRPEGLELDAIEHNRAIVAHDRIPLQVGPHQQIAPSYNFV